MAGVKALLVVICAVVFAFNVVGQEKPVRLVAEAEDFKISKGWGIVPFRENYFASTFAISFLSRMACGGSPEQLPGGQTAIAEQLGKIRYTDQLVLRGLYAQRYNWSVV